MNMSLRGRDTRVEPAAIPQSGEPMFQFLFAGMTAKLLMSIQSATLMFRVAQLVYANVVISMFFTVTSLTGLSL